MSIEISWAQSNGLPMSAKNPEIEDHMVYFVAALHQVHYLVRYLNFSSHSIKLPC